MSGYYGLVIITPLPQHTLFPQIKPQMLMDSFNIWHKAWYISEENVANARHVLNYA
jgi:hypothetical protein